jgi:hypothetical protein
MRRNDVPSISFDVDFRVLYFVSSNDEGSENVSCLGDGSNTFCFIFICPFDHFQSDFIDFLLLTLLDVHLFEIESLDK